MTERPVAQPPSGRRKRCRHQATMAGGTGARAQNRGSAPPPASPGWPGSTRQGLWPQVEGDEQHGIAPAAAAAANGGSTWEGCGPGLHRAAIGRDRDLPPWAAWPGRRDAGRASTCARPERRPARDYVPEDLLTSPTCWEVEEPGRPGARHLEPVARARALPFPQPLVVRETAAGQPGSPFLRAASTPACSAKGAAALSASAGDLTSGYQAAPSASSSWTTAVAGLGGWRPVRPVGYSSRGPGTWLPASSGQQRPAGGAASARAQRGHDPVKSSAAETRVTSAVDLTGSPRRRCRVCNRAQPAAATTFSRSSTTTPGAVRVRYSQAAVEQVGQRAGHQDKDDASATGPQPGPVRRVPSCRGRLRPAAAG